MNRGLNVEASTFHYRVETCRNDQYQPGGRAGAAPTIGGYKPAAPSA